MSVESAAKPQVRFEDAAEYKSSGISGWVCKTCRRYWADDERMAKWCCATDLPCECGGRNTEKHYTHCKDCRRKRDDERWSNLERVEWDGETPLCGWQDDRFYFDEDELTDHIGEHLEDGSKLEDVRLVLCKPTKPRHFEMAEFLSDTLPQDYDPGPAFDEIDRIVNDWIKARMPLSWEPTNKAISAESLRYLVDQG
jgi:hypothetical protein